MKPYLVPALAAILLVIPRPVAGDSSPLLRPVTLRDNGGPVNVVLPIVAMQCSGENGCLIRALGLYKGEQVGINFRFPKIHHKDRPPSESAIAELPGGITIEPAGTSTQNFLRMLSALYGHPRFRFPSPRELSLSAVTLQGNPDKIETARLEIKVFHGDDESQLDYFELFINIDRPHGLIELAEKDSDYRLPILRAFGLK